MCCVSWHYRVRDKRRSRRGALIKKILDDKCFPVTIPFFKVAYKHLFCMLQYGIVGSKCPTDIFNALKFTEVQTHYKMDSMRIHSVYFTVRSTSGIICILCTSSHQVSCFSLLNIIDNFMLTSNLLLLLFTQSQVKP